VAPLGVDRDAVEEALRVALCAAEYSLVKIHVSQLLEPFVNSVSERYLERKRDLMDAGDEMRRQFSEFFDKSAPRGDAVALAAITELRERRQEINKSEELSRNPEESEDDFARRLASTPLTSMAFLLNSLKHPDELKLLKRTYGPAFVSIGVHVPPDARRDFLFAQAEVGQDQKAIALATALLRRDQTGEDESGRPVKLGQDVSDAFNETDFILDASRPKAEIVGQLTRLVELVFGNVFLTPAREELGMFLARAAQVRSGSMARQIGASILRDDGSVIAVGTNEVARPISGGQYWFEDDFVYSGRDIAYQSRDTSDEFRQEMVADALQLLDDVGVLSDEYSTRKIDGKTLEGEDVRRMREERLRTLYINPGAALRRSKLRDNIDHIRAVHAEAAAIIDSARNGVATRSSTMFATTFPCHECARHIVAAGIKEVVYLAPYPKSAVGHLFADSIQVDPKQRDPKKVLFRTLVGVAPSRYLEFFTADRERKDKTGKRDKFDLRTAPPHLPYYTPSAEAAAANNEVLELNQFVEFLKSKSSDRTTGDVK
jgi:cytidine deaminase